MKNYVDDLTPDYEEMKPWGTSQPTKHKHYARCYESHPALPIAGFKVYGGNSGSPIVLDADIYVSLQAGQYVAVPHPWQGKKPITQIMYSIVDQSIPSNKADFKKMIEWLCNQLREGKKIHIGCIGGHGRTGMVLAAMVNVMMPEEKEPIGYVRKHYCVKAVESSSQVKFLMENYGAEKIAPRHADTSHHGSSTGKWSAKQPSLSNSPKSGGWNSSSPVSPVQSVRFANSKRQIDPVPSARNIFVETK